MSLRLEHEPQGNPCQYCGYYASQHRGYRKKVDYRRECDRAKYIGIDGEGQGEYDHKYVLLAASDEDGSSEWILRPSLDRDRLTTMQCLDFIMALPKDKRTKIMAYSFNYDLTMMLRDIDNSTLYYLFRPELRQRRGEKSGQGPWPVNWKGYQLNYQGAKFTLSDKTESVVIWDIFRFYQSKFVNALKDWNIGNPDMRARMSLMKDKRSEFDKESPAAVEAYCLSECRAMAELGRKLVEAHNDAGLKLTSYYGAGSSGGAMLKKMGIKSKIRAPEPAMKQAVACSFFGGRFENSVIGRVEGKVYGYDISSAYPYQAYMLPCLEHGHWRLTHDEKDLENARAALVHYGIENRDGMVSWGPFPFREKTGTISYPHTSGGGWVWLAEFKAGRALFPKSVHFREAWVYSCECVCRPFARIAEYYLFRLSLGKDGPGIVAKLAVNSCYGKLAQSLGNAPYNCWIWASMIPSGCRAQTLEMLGLHRDMSNALMIATDGLYTREKIDCPRPIDTGTDVLISGKKKPLGGWEEKIHERGVFVARPGIYFPLNPSEDELKDVRARGIGKAIVHEHWDTIMRKYEAYGPETRLIIRRMKDNRLIKRFCGAKTCISRTADVENLREAILEDAPPIFHYNRAKGEGGGPSYGQWIARPVEMSFDPRPKREGIAKDGRSLVLREFDRDLESSPYRKAMRDDDELMTFLIGKLQTEEQPDKDLAVY